MKLSEYLKGKRGRGAQIARAMGIAPQQLYQWASGARPIPSGHCPDIEQQTNGEVRCEELRPDVNWEVVRKAGRSRRNTEKH